MSPHGPWRLRSCAIIGAVAAALAVSACGGAQTQASGEPSGHFPVAVDTASFPSAQKLAEKTHLVIAVRNAGHRAIPNVAVTICNVTCAYPAPKGEGTSAAAFGADISQPHLANPSRPIWIVDAAPGPCSYSCRSGGAGAAVTAYANTWALGRLAPGHTARFDWAVTAVKTGRHVVAWEVAAGLAGKAKAVLANGGGTPHGTFTVHVGSRPPQTYVNNNGRIVNAH
ncbi:MAG TPA: hypothetical protein VE127_16830 [Solirubrobacteraceae bacterium]|nr:hypothetical protein [Solirubrobacteraceae bacterium]